MIRILAILLAAVNVVVVSMAGVTAFVLGQDTEKPYDAIALAIGAFQGEEDSSGSGYYSTVSESARSAHRSLRHDTIRFGTPQILLSTFNCAMLFALLIQSPRVGKYQGIGNMAFANGAIAFVLLIWEPNYLPNPITHLAQLESWAAATPGNVTPPVERRAAILNAVLEAKVSAHSILSNYNRNEAVFLSANLVNVLLFGMLQFLVRRRNYLR
jgi:hypothetical protein